MNEEILARLRSRLTDNETVPNDEILMDCLENAKHIILSRRFPFGNYPDEIEDRYLDLQYRIAVDIYNKMGAEGEKTHNENGISRTFEGAWVSPQLLQEIVPYAGAI